MTMTPMSEKRWKQIRNTATMYGNDALSEEDFNAVLDEITRLRTLPPEVVAAMERYAKRMRDDTVSEYCIGDLFTIATHFTALFHPTPKVSP